jgi:hypothetical protein
MRNVPYSLLLTALFTIPVICGCATGGNATASGSSTATGGAATTTVGASPSISLGSDVAKAATDAATAILKNTPNPTAGQKSDAVSTGVQAGITKAKAGGQTPTSSQVSELKQVVQQAVDTLLSH